MLGHVHSSVHFFFGLSLLSLAGCGGGDAGTADRPATVPVQGTVTLDGKPIEGATVTFMPATQARPGQPAQGHAAVSRTDAEGHYELMTFEAGDGVVPGDYVVTVVKQEVPEAKELSMEEYIAQGPQAPSADAGPKHLLPEQYAKRQTSPLKVTVTESESEPLDFELSGK